MTWENDIILEMGNQQTTLVLGDCVVFFIVYLLNHFIPNIDCSWSTVYIIIIIIISDYDSYRGIVTREPIKKTEQYQSMISGSKLRAGKPCRAQPSIDWTYLPATSRADGTAFCCVRHVFLCCEALYNQFSFNFYHTVHLRWWSARRLNQMGLVCLVGCKLLLIKIDRSDKWVGKTNRSKVRVNRRRTYFFCSIAHNNCTRSQLLGKLFVIAWKQ